MDSMVSKEVASELFDELPHWDDEDMFDDNALSKVI
jgi:hypothetical protein